LEQLRILKASSAFEESCYKCMIQKGIIAEEKMQKLSDL
jgi:hypothetical protein